MSSLIDNTVKVQTSQKDAEIKALLSQINPHFLFNTLESIRMRSIVLGEMGTAELIESLSNMFRTSTYWDKEFIPISQELDYIRDYLKIMNLRTNNRFNLNLKLADDVKNYYMPKLMLQPLVENSINHGFREMIDECLLSISFVENGDNIEITVQDNGMGMTEDELQKLTDSMQYTQLENEKNTTGLAKDHSGIGLRNVNNRLRDYFGESYCLFITSKSKSYTKIYFKIPIIKESYR